MGLLYFLANMSCRMDSGLLDEFQSRHLQVKIDIDRILVRSFLEVANIYDIDFK